MGCSQVPELTGRAVEVRDAQDVSGAALLDRVEAVGARVVAAVVVGGGSHDGAEEEGGEGEELHGCGFDM